MRASRDAAHNYITDIRVELRQQQTQLKTLLLRLQAQLDHISACKQDQLPARSEALRRAETFVAEALTQNGNNVCADCSAPPTHARVDLGITLCSKCAQAHASLILEAEPFSTLGLSDETLNVAGPCLAMQKGGHQRLYALPGLASPLKLLRQELWPVTANLLLVRALGNTAVNDVLEYTLRGSGLAKTFKPGPSCSDSERAIFIKSKVRF